MPLRFESSYPHRLSGPKRARILRPILRRARSKALFGRQDDPGQNRTIHGSFVKDRAGCVPLLLTRARASRSRILERRADFLNPEQITISWRVVLKSMIEQTVSQSAEKRSGQNASVRGRQVPHNPAKESRDEKTHDALHRWGVR